MDRAVLRGPVLRYALLGAANNGTRRAMSLSLRTVAAAGLVGLGGCAHVKADEPYTVIVRGSGSSCLIEIDGRQVTTDELLAVARQEAKPGRSAYIDANVEATPFRCFGGTMYTLQKAGFKKVGFTSEPAPQ